MAEPNPENLLGQKSDPTLRDLLAPLFRRKRAFAYTFVGIMLGTCVAAFMLNNTHKASMELLVNGQREEPTVTSQSTQGPAAAPAVSDYDLGSEVEILKSPDLLQEVVRANHLDDNERKSFTRFLHRGATEDWYMARATQHLGGKLEVTTVSKSNLIQVTYKSGDPQLAYNVLQTLGKLYLAKHLEVHRPQGSYAFFSSETQKYQQALADSEARLADFTQAMGTASPDAGRRG